MFILESEVDVIVICFITISENCEYRSWSFECIEDILKSWWCDDWNFPSAYDKIFAETFIIDNEEVKAKTVNDAIHELERIYWKKVNM